MADDERGCDQPRVRLYVVGVTEPTPEPTLTDVLAAINALASKVEGVDNKSDDIALAMQAAFGHVMVEIAGVKDEVQRAEASITTRVADVQNVVRTLKGDLADHIGNPDNHHRHAA